MALEPDVEIELLTGHGHLGELLADWHLDEWGHLYNPAVWDRAAAVREFEAMAAPDSSDHTWVAFGGSGRTADDVLGSVSLVANDDLAGWEHVTPWLASLYVRPDARGKGVAAALITDAIAAARQRGHEYLHLFTSGREDYWESQGWRIMASVEASGHPATVMARGTNQRAARQAVCSRWCADPDTNGAYSYLRVGGTPAHRERIGVEILPRLWFAGEATSVEFPATMHGAWFSGARAADQVLADGVNGTVLVVGAGIAGMVAAQRLRETGHDVVVLESKAQPGGRITTDTSLGVPLPLGGAWLHGEEGHPLATMVDWAEEEWSHRAMFVVGHGALNEAEVALMAAAYDHVKSAYAAAPPGMTAAQVMDDALGGLSLEAHVRAGAVSWLTAECESLYAAPMGDIAAYDGFEPYELPGDDRLITTNLQVVIDRLADGLDIRCDHRVAELTHTPEGWRTDTGVDAAAVIVTIPIGALRTGRITFSPPLPADVVGSLSYLGAGPVTKVFATFDTAWWPFVRPIRLAGQNELTAVTDMTAVTGVPTLCGFAVGDAARRIEHLGPDELCRLLDRILAESGLTAWDATDNRAAS